MARNVPPPAPQPTAPVDDGSASKRRAPTTQSEQDNESQPRSGSHERSSLSNKGHGEEHDRRRSPSIPTVEVQPPTQSTNDDFPRDGTLPEEALHPSQSRERTRSYAEPSPLLSPEYDGSLGELGDDNQTVGNGLLPLRQDSVPIEPISRPKPRHEKTMDPTHLEPEDHTTGRTADDDAGPHLNPTVEAKPDRRGSRDMKNPSPQPQLYQPPKLPQHPDGDMSIPEAEAKENLLAAAWNGDIEGVTKALRSTSCNVSNSRGLTPLHLACERDNLAIAILLLDRGAKMQARANGDRLPLHLAARYGSPETVEMLLERHGCDVNATTVDGRTALHYAASVADDDDEERRDVVRILRDAGANPTIRDKRGDTAMDVAQRRDFWKVCGTLRRMEKRWEEEHELAGHASGHASGHGTKHDDGKEKGNWLQRHGFMK